MRMSYETCVCLQVRDVLAAPSYDGESEAAPGCTLPLGRSRTGHLDSADGPSVLSTSGDPKALYGAAGVRV